MDDKLKQFYDLLKQDKDYSSSLPATFEEFNNPEKLKQFHEVLMQDKDYSSVIPSDFNEFYGQALKKKEQSEPSGNTAQQSVGATPSTSKTAIEQPVTEFAQPSFQLDFKQYNPEILKQPIADTDEKRYKLLLGYNDNHLQNISAIDKQIEQLTQQGNNDVANQLQEVRGQIVENNKAVQQDLNTYNEKANTVLGSLQDISNLTDVATGNAPTINPEQKQVEPQSPLNNFFGDIERGALTGTAGILDALDGASKAVSDATGGALSYSGAFKKEAENMRKVSEAQPRLEGETAHAVATSVGSLIPLIAESSVFPALKLGKIKGIAVNLGNLAPTLATNGFFGEYSRSGDIKKSAIESGKGFGEGVLVHALGYPANILGEELAKKGAPVLFNVLAQMGTGAATFGGAEATRQMITGNYNTPELISSAVLGGGLIAHSAFNIATANYATADAKTIKAARESKKSIEDIRNEAIDYAEEAQSAETKEDKDAAMTKALAVNSIADVKAMDEMASKNPEGFKKAIAESDMPDELKKQLGQKVEESDPVHDKAYRLSERILDIDAQINFNNLTIDNDYIRESKNRVLESGKKEIQKEIEELYKPKEDAGTTTKSGASVPTINEPIKPSTGTEPLKTEQNAAKQGKISESNKSEHKDGNSARETEKASDSNSDERSGQEEEVYKITKAEIDKKREVAGKNPAVSEIGSTHKELMNNSIKRIEADPSIVQEIMSRLKEKPQSLTDQDVSDLAYHNAKLEIATKENNKSINSLADKVLKEPSDVDASIALEKEKLRQVFLQDQIDELHNVVRKEAAGSAARTLGALRIGLNSELTLTEMIAKKRASLGGKQLSESELKEIHKLKGELDTVNKSLEEITVKASIENEALKAKVVELEKQKNLDDARKNKTKQDRKILKSDILAERKNIIDEIAAIHKKHTGELGSLNPTALIEMTPAIAKLFKNYAKETSLGFSEIVDDIHETLKNTIEGITKKDIEDAILYKKEKPTKSDLTKRISELKKGLRESTGKRQEESLSAYKTRISNEINTLQNKIKAKDFSKPEKLKTTLDLEATRLKAKKERIRNEFEKGIRADLAKRRTISQKGIDGFVKFQRAAKMSGIAVLGKLGMASGARLITTPLDEGAGFIYSLALPQIAEKAPRQGVRAYSKEGRSSFMQAEGKALSKYFTEGFKDAYDILRTGESNLDVLYGKMKPQERQLVDYLASLHEAIKSPAKRAEWERSFIKRMEYESSIGNDISDELVLDRIKVEALKDAERSIFKQDNYLSKAFESAMRPLESSERLTPKMIAALGRTLLPFVKIPTNIALELGVRAVGAPLGAVEAATAFAKGIEKLPTEQADMIMRHLKQGSIGAALLLYGFFNPDDFGGIKLTGRQKKQDEDELKHGESMFFGNKVGTWASHVPALQVPQAGASLRRYIDTFIDEDKGDYSEAILYGSIAVGLGLANEIPFVKETTQIENFKDVKNVKKNAANWLKSSFIPQISREGAKWGDKDIYGEVNERAPETFFDNIKMDIPGLRKQVPYAE